MYVILFTKSIKGGRVGAYNRYFESNQCEEILNILRKPLKKLITKFQI